MRYSSPSWFFSTGNQNVTAAETLSVQIIQPPSETSVPIYTVVQLTANASGGPGGYYYRWYANDVEIPNNATSATCAFNVTQIGTYRIGCMIADATGVVSGSATAPEIYLYVTPVVAANAPSTSPETNSANQELTWIVAAVVVVSVIGVATIMIIKQRRSRQTNNQ